MGVEEVGARREVMGGGGACALTVGMCSSHEALVVAWAQGGTDPGW